MTESSRGFINSSKSSEHSKTLRRSKTSEGSKTSEASKSSEGSKSSGGSKTGIFSILLGWQTRKKRQTALGSGFWLASGALTLGLGLFLVWLCYNSWYGLPLLIPVGILVVRIRKKAVLTRRKQLLLFHFRDFLVSLLASLRAGYSIENSLPMAAADLKRRYGLRDPLYRGLSRILTRLRLGIPVEELFLDFGREAEVEEIRTFGQLLQIARRTGGNTVRILQDTWRTLCQRIDTEREIQTLLSGKKHEQGILCLMPALIIVYLRLGFPGFTEKLYGNLFGVLLMTGCLCVYLLAWFLGRKIVEIEV